MLLETWYQIYFERVTHDAASDTLAEIMRLTAYSFGAVYVDDTKPASPTHAERDAALLLLEGSDVDKSERMKRLASLQGQLSKLRGGSMPHPVDVMMMIPSNYVAAPEYTYSNSPTKHLIQLEFLTDADSHQVLWTIGSCDIQEEQGWCFETLFTTHLASEFGEDETPASGRTIFVEAFDDTADPERIIKKLEDIFAEDSIPINTDSGITLRKFSLLPDT